MENGAGQDGSAAAHQGRQGISLPPIHASAPQQPPASYNDDDGMDLDAAEEQPASHPTQSNANHAHAHSHDQQPGSKKTRSREESLDALSKSTAATAEDNWDPELARKRPHSGTNWSWAGDGSSDRNGGYRHGGVGRTLRALPSSGRVGGGKQSTASSAWAAPSSRS